MFKALDENKNEISIEKAAGTEKYFCPVCHGALVVKAKKSETITAHFAHKSRKECDTFSHDMSEWHKAWQNKFPLKNQEVPLPFENPCHRADVLAYGYVIEFQHSPLSAEEFDERNKFYTSIGKKVIWVFDVNEKYNSKCFSKVEPEYIFDGYRYENGEQKNNWIIKEYRVATAFHAIFGSPDACDSNGIEYLYDCNDKFSSKKTYEWKWKRPLKTFIHYNPAVDKNVTVFLEFYPGKLEKVIWCDDEIDSDVASYIAEDLHGNGEKYDATSQALYLEYRDAIAQRSCFKAFSATEYSVSDFLLEIKNKFL
ncbi:competence protein CoiA family protein [Ruminococcus sp. HUN007]|uniref:competence protein CoiA n=1 Tax=Ruminococcus sp. HUN007 TaxID=1514668 RepID=UPI000679A33D|nr:competence protein CoiA family protein [Ruminococcus sp. HUN007]